MNFWATRVLQIFSRVEQPPSKYSKESSLKHSYLLMSGALLASVTGTGPSRPTAPASPQQPNATPGYSIEHHNDARAPAPVPAISQEPEQPQSLWHSMTNPGSNPLLSAGFSLMILGAVLGIGRKGLTQGAALAQKRMLVTLEIPSKDKAHGWLLTWMEEQSRRTQALPPLSPMENAKDMLGFAARHQPGSGNSGADAALPPPVRIHSRDLAVQSVLPQQQSSDGGASAAQAQAMMMSGAPISKESSPRQKATFSLVPGPGTHWLRYHGAWIRLQRERNAKLIDISTGAPWETLTLTTLYSSRSIFPRLLSEAQSLASQNIEGKTIIYTAWGVEWRSFGQPRKVRELDSVVLAEGQRQRITDDVKSFLGRGKWYARRGIPYRRGYLLHGSPGSGKTSIIQALAGSLDMNICLLNLSERGLTDDKLNHLLSLAPERSIILLEDIDAAFPSRTRGDADAASAAPEKREYQTSVTFSGLLNALDGVASGESRIVMMTTNHVERLDPALIRPGRVDLIEELGDADETMVRDLFERFYGVARDEVREQASEASSSTANDRPNGAIAPSPTPSITDETALRQLSSRLVDAVTRVSVLRRKELGLDESGRYPLNHASPTVDAEKPSVAPSSTTPPPASAPRATSSAGYEGNFGLKSSKASGARSARARRTKASPLPAKRGGVSMAELQGLFIRYPLDPHGAVEEVEEELASVEDHL